MSEDNAQAIASIIAIKFNEMVDNTLPEKKVRACELVKEIQLELQNLLIDIRQEMEK